MPTTANSITYYVAADGTLRDGEYGSIAQQPRINYGTEYAVTLSFPPSTIAEGDQLQVALNRTRTFFSSASATGDAPVAAVAKHEVTAEEAAAQEVAVVLSTNTRAMIDQVNGIDHPVRGFFGVHVLRGQSFVTLAVADALMMSLESGPDAISPSLPVIEYPTREEAEAIKNDAVEAANKAEEEAGRAEQSAEDANTAKTAAETAQQAAEDANTEAQQAKDDAVTAAGEAEAARDEAVATLANKRDILQTLVTSSSTTLVVEAGKSYNWTVSAASTISMKAADKVANKETRIDIYIDLQDGGSVSGDGVTVADAVLQSGWYKLIWDGTNATLYSTKAGGAASVITIPAATTAYTLQDNKHYQQVPSAVPTYTLPTATMDGLVHEITVLVDFLHVTSCSFVDASGVPVTLQSAISPQIGEAYIFRCYWYGKWRVVPLKIRNAATASSSNGVVEVSDAVAGDALALKMTAPRSVVVNQNVQNGNFNDGASGWIKGQGASGISVENGVMSIVRGTHEHLQCTVSRNMRSRFVQGHTVMVHLDIKLDVATSGETLGDFYVGYIGGVFTQWGNSLKNITQSFDWQTQTFKVTLRENASDLFVGLYRYNNSSKLAEGSVVYLRNVMLVDLTQYFNGDQTLINSITSWDDLVAYDPRFASYVEYNTGTVEGVTPQVKVMGKNLFDQSRFLTEVTGCTLTQDGYYTAPTANFYTTYYSNNGSLLPSSAFKQSVQYTVRALGYGNKTDGANFYITIFHADGTHVNSSGTTSTATEITVTSTQGKTVNRICFTWGGGNTSYIKDVQIEIASSATSYEPYHDGGTVQAPEELFAVGNAADEFEAVSGVTTRKMGSYTFTANTDGWRYDSSGLRIVKSFPDRKSGSSNVICGNGYISAVNALTAPSKSIILAINNDNIFIKNETLTTVNEFIAELNGTTFYYELATPTTSQSTPTQISLQAGNNTAMQTDGGRTLAGLAMTYENLPSKS